MGPAPAPPLLPYTTLFRSTYTPDANFNGADSFTFTASDGALGSNEATVSITVNPANDAPVAADSSATGDEDTTISAHLCTTVTYQDRLSYAAWTEPAHGSV